MKLIIQIPCYNESGSLPVTLSKLPRKLDNIDKVEWLVIDDGSDDNTYLTAKENGVDHIVRHVKNLGLARAFASGIEESVRLGADIIVNTDADNQYDAGSIPDLIKPILEGKADMVIGARPISSIPHFSLLKKMLQKIGSWVVRKISHSEIIDAPSGFRAISRSAAMKLNIFTDYTYTLETILQARQKGIVIASVPVNTNPFLRKSRLLKSVPDYIKKSLLTIVRIYMTYSPAKFFFYLGLIPLILGSVLIIRFLYFYFTQVNAGHIQSLIIAALLIGSGFILFLIGLIADLIAVNRKLLEKINWRIQNVEEIILKEKNKNGK